MKRNTLRSIGLGFLLAGVLTGIFAILQGHVPIEGTTVQSIFDSGDGPLIESLGFEKSQLEDQLSQLESARNNLNANIASIQEDQEVKDKEIDDLHDTIESLLAKEDQSQESSSLNEDNSSNPVDEEGIFTIQAGESSSEIADRLEQAGYVDSAAEFQDLLDSWNLNSVIQSGQHEINPNMSIHEIASIITGGAYYYNH